MPSICRLGWSEVFGCPPGAEVLVLLVLGHLNLRGSRLCFFFQAWVPLTSFELSFFVGISGREVCLEGRRGRDPKCPRGSLRGRRTGSGSLETEYGSKTGPRSCRLLMNAHSPFLNFQHLSNYCHSTSMSFRSTRRESDDTKSGGSDRVV